MADRPNLVLLMCDQLNARVLGCYGGPVPTPNLDRLAARGTLFTEAVCPTPFCSPSRASIVTGVYPHTHGINHNVNRRDYPAIPAPATEQGITLADTTTDRLLNAAGYATHHYGKWHLLDEDLPYYADMFTEHDGYEAELAERFEQVRRQPRGSWMDWYNWALPVGQTPDFRAAVAALGNRWDELKYAEFLVKMGRLELPLSEWFDARVTDHAVEAIRSHGDQPLSLTCSWNQPHDPNVVPSPFYEQFDPAELELPSSWEHLEERFEGDWSRQSVVDLGEAGAREFLRIYYASVAMIDHEVGRVLDTLDVTGQADHTVVVFTADHGDMAGGHGMIWKSTGAFYDDVARVPLIIAAPGVRAATSRAAANLVDLMPTLLEFAGEAVPAHCQGHSLRRQLGGGGAGEVFPKYTFSERVGANPERRRVVPAGTRGGLMARGEGWKYVRYPTGLEYLYHLADDPDETRNLIDEPTCAERRAELTSAVARWLALTGPAGMS